MASASSQPTPIAWLLAPALLLFVLFFVLPFGVMAVMSFFSSNPVTNPNAFLTTRHYERFIFDSAGIFHDALWATLRIGLITTVVSLLIGYPLAHWMARMQSRLGHALVLMAVIAPHADRHRRAHLRLDDHPAGQGRHQHDADPVGRDRKAACR